MTTLSSASKLPHRHRVREDNFLSTPHNISRGQNFPCQTRQGVDKMATYIEQFIGDKVSQRGRTRLVIVSYA